MSKEIKEFRIVDKKFLEVIYVDDCTFTRIDLEALFGAKVVEEKNEQNCSCKGLKALERIKYDDLEWTSDFYPPECDIIEKELKALDTIKNKQVNVKNLIEYCYNIALSYEEYVDNFNYSDNYFDLGKDLLTENEYDLLNEVLL